MLIEPSSICKLPDQKHVFTAAGPNPRGEYQQRRRFGTCRLGIVPSVRIQSDPIRQATLPSASGCRMAPLHGAFTAPHGDRCSPCLALNGTKLRRAQPCRTFGLAGMRWPVSARNQDGQQLEHRRKSSQPRCMSFSCDACAAAWDTYSAEGRRHRSSALCRVTQ